MQVASSGKSMQCSNLIISACWGRGDPQFQIKGSSERKHVNACLEVSWERVVEGCVDTNISAQQAKVTYEILQGRLKEGARHSLQ